MNLLIFECFMKDQKRQQNIKANITAQLQSLLLSQKIDPMKIFQENVNISKTLNIISLKEDKAVRS